MFNARAASERILHHIPTFKLYFVDRTLQKISGIFPDQLPKWMEDFHDKYQHYLQLKVADQGIDEARDYLQEFFKDHEGGYFECTPKEAKVAATIVM